MPDKRVIIGETERAGLPLTQPVATGPESSPIRFVKHADHFSLECFNSNLGRFVEVPVILADSTGVDRLEPGPHDGPRQTRCCITLPGGVRCRKPINHTGKCQFTP